ncbi:hypothetical protein ACR3K2_17570 [Cryptosporidium serpentis]
MKHFQWKVEVLLIVRTFVLFSLLHKSWGTTAISASSQKAGLKFLQDICRALEDSDNANLEKCYESNIYFNEFLWGTAKILNELQRLTFKIPLPLNKLTTECTPINKDQCVTIIELNYNDIDNHIEVSYTKVTEIITPVNPLCIVNNNIVRGGYNALWFTQSKQQLLTTETSINLGRGYQSLVQLEDTKIGIYNIICQDLKVYLNFKSYLKELDQVIFQVAKIKSANLPMFVPILQDIKLEIKEFDFECNTINTALDHIKINSEEIARVNSDTDVHIFMVKLDNCPYLEVDSIIEVWNFS